MSDEFVPQDTPVEQPSIPPAPVESPAPAPVEPSSSSENKRAKSKPVIVYGLVMFVAAFLLLLLSFLMQQRNHAALMNGLTSSMKNAESVTELKVQKQALMDEKKELETELGEVQKTAATAVQERDAVVWLCTIQEAYERRDLEGARALLSQFQSGALAPLLPKTPVVSGSPSPAEHYAALLEKLS